MYSLLVNGTTLVIEIDKNGDYLTYSDLKNEIFRKEKSLVIDYISILHNNKKTTIPLDIDDISSSDSIESLIGFPELSIDEIFSDQQTAYVQDKIKESINKKLETYETSLEREERIRNEQAEAQRKKDEKDIETEKDISSMLVVTSSKMSGFTITRTLGLARGSTVRAKHIGKDIMAELKNIVGGEIKGYTELIAEGREEALYRMKVDAYELGADAVIDARFGSATLGIGISEIMAYGTAVKAEKREEE